MLLGSHKHLPRNSVKCCGSSLLVDWKKNKSATGNKHGLLTKDQMLLVCNKKSGSVEQAMPLGRRRNKGFLITFLSERLYKGQWEYLTISLDFFLIKVHLQGENNIISYSHFN